MSDMTTVPKPTVSLAGAIIEHPTLGLLLQLRDVHAPNHPHHWGIFGGHMEAGESPEVAIWRELAEELQLTPAMVDGWRLGEEFPHVSGGRVYVFYMTTTVTTDALVLGEGEQMVYAPHAELNPPQPFRGYPFTGVSAQALASYLAKIKTR